ncbi:hypothetical protein PVAND_002312 [Polypedilum vanderplanki]|uniref:Uncharacterized protein n=1 Tax=Polypedilum vanderplanki TaxID=319348 RepID=A0A9J6BQU8_POLVA|nr:hypothetical protein PVAND_002312 [Polypedilum vanderplanki]
MEGTYEYELERAELLGIEPPDRVEWEKKNKERLEAEAEQEKAEIAQNVENEGEQAKRTGGKLDELNSILSATQNKINKFKTVCGSFTNLLKIRSSSPAPAASTESTTTSSDNQTSSTNEETPVASMNNAIDKLEKMKEVIQQTEATKNQEIDISSKINKNMDALDSLLMKSERAEISLQQQNKQMSKFLR